MKVYLYHRVPDELSGDILYPLNHFKVSDPDIYDREAQKYKGRERVIEQVLPTLGCL